MVRTIDGFQAKRQTSVISHFKFNAKTDDEEIEKTMVTSQSRCILNDWASADKTSILDKLNLKESDKIEHMNTFVCECKIRFSIACNNLPVCMYPTCMYIDSIV